ncbi:MAG: trypsin-like peptidase domain-containing protein, partial [Nocardioidaceae bacterium]
LIVEIDSRVPGFLGRVLNGNHPVGTCFQVAPGVLVTAFHVLNGIGLSDPDAVVSFDPLQGGDAHEARVARPDALHDLAVMVTDNPLPGCVAGLEASNDVMMTSPVSITGVGGLDDSGHTYGVWATPGEWAGYTTRDEVPLSLVDAKGLVKGMSGAPVLADERVVGVVEGRYNSADGWGRDTVFVARTEDLDPLLVGLTDIRLPRRGWAADVVDALAGWLTARCGAVQADVLGNEQQQAFREVVSRTIGRVTGSHAGELAADRRAFLAATLVEHSDRLVGLGELPHLAAAVHVLVNSHDEPSDLHLVAPPGLADALITEINLGVLDNARTGGPLALLVTEANFPEFFALDEQLRAARETILARLDSYADEPRARGAPITINTFTGRWRPLRADYLDPTDKRAVILQEGFTGRAWLVREIDKFVRDHDRGYFVIQADAGTGKTAFALWYSGLDERPIHFTGYSKGARTTRSAVRNLAAQLIALLRLDEFIVAGHIPEMEDWSSWMHQVLTAAAKQRAKDAPGHPIVLVVDGLDEADESDVDHLPFGLPDDLPPGVYVVATVRTKGLPHQPKPPMVVCDWNGQEAQAQQRRDLRAFTTESVQLRLMTALHDDGLVPEAFIDTLLDQCGDVWLYLHYVLEELASGYRRPREVPLLPAGLEGYYHNTIERFCRRAKDERWRVPLLATLAIAVEPLDVETLVSLAGPDHHLPVARFLNGPMRPFCTVSRATQTDAAGQPERFSLKHPSFAEYLAAGPGPDIDDLTGHQSEDVRSRRTRLAAECRAAGQR